MTAPRMTPQNATYGQIEPLEGAMFLQGFDSIGRTSGLIAAGGRGQGGDKLPIELDGQNE